MSLSGEQNSAIGSDYCSSDIFILQDVQEALDRITHSSNSTRCHFGGLHLEDGRLFLLRVWAKGGIPELRVHYTRTDQINSDRFQIQSWRSNHSM